MTITNEERREVAARLREIDFGWVSESSARLLFKIEHALGLWTEGSDNCEGVANRLAELIEPEERVLTNMELAQSEIMLMGDRVFISGFGHYTKERTCQNKAIDSSFECSKCNCFVESGDYWGSAYICDGDWNYCPNCGRKVID